jgi:hypothetical protein
MFLAALIPDAHPFAFDDDSRVGGFIGFVLAQVMPDMGFVSRHNMADIIFIERAVHGT